VPEDALYKTIIS